MPSSLLAVGSKFLAFWSVQPSGTGRLICWAAFPEKSRNMPTSVLCLPLNPLTQHPPQSFYLADKTTSQQIDIVKKENCALISPNFFRKRVSPCRDMNHWDKGVFSAVLYCNAHIHKLFCILDDILHNIISIFLRWNSNTLNFLILLSKIYFEPIKRTHLFSHRSSGMLFSLPLGNLHSQSGVTCN